MHHFIRRHLDPAGRLGEILFGLIMALGFTASVRLGLDEADNKELFLGILGCNLAWAIVDGVMHVLGEVFERGRRLRLIRDVRAARSEDEARQHLSSELDDVLELDMTDEEREQFQAVVLGAIRRGGVAPKALTRADVLGGVAAALVVLLATFPVVVPFLVVGDPNVAVRVSNVVATGMLFLLGARWANMVGGNPWRIGGGLALIGAILVLITVALGG